MPDPPLPIPPLPLPRPAAQPRAAAQAAPAAPTPGRPLPSVDRFIIWNEPNHQGLLLPQWKADGRTPASPGRLPRDAARGLRGGQGGAPHAPPCSSATRRAPAASAARARSRRWSSCASSPASTRKLKPRTGGDCAGFTQLPGDGWAHHPYSQNERPERVSDPKKEPGDLRLADTPVLARTLDRLVRMGRLAPANRNIHLTEFGYETKGIPGRPRVNETQQARWMTWAEHIADRVPTVRSFAQFLLRDQPPAPVRVSQSDKRPFGEYSTGLLHVDGSEKVIARTFLAGLFAQRRPKGKVLVYGRLRLGAGPKVIVLQRQVKGGRVEARRAPGDRRAPRVSAHDRAPRRRLLPAHLSRAPTASAAPAWPIKPVPAAR